MVDITTMITTITIHDYRPEHQPWFEKFNRTWIEKYFWMEPLDVAVLQHPNEHILAQGGEILMAYADREVAGTVALKLASPGVYEFTKMAVDEKFQGHKIGRKLAEAAIEKARVKGAHKIILYSHTSLQTAIGLYRKLGFVEVPVDGPYKRSDIKMELVLTKDTVTVRTARLADVSLLCELGKITFVDTFEQYNTAADMDLYVEKNFTPQQVTKEMTTEEGAVFFLAFAGDKPAGYAKVRTGEQPEQFAGVPSLEIERVYVLKEFFGRQVAQALLSTCLEHAKKKDAKQVWLGVWEHNPRAIAFYKKIGFEKFGEHVFVLGTDPQTDWLMKKEL